MVVWTCSGPSSCSSCCPSTPSRRLSELDVTRAELDRWEDLTRRMFVPFHGDGIISQFAGYDELEELDWDGYRRAVRRHPSPRPHPAREDDTPNRYKVAKQADVLMLFYLLTADELHRIMRSLGYDWTPDRIPATIEYYRARTSHGSTLSAVVHRLAAGALGPRGVLGAVRTRARERHRRHPGRHDPRGDPPRAP
jgi:trehalose/maltose hydrolase-like predicted phosphorylase